MFNSYVFEIFITSTFDTEEEICLIEKSVEEWNRHNAEDEGIMLKLLRWEKDSYPSMYDGRGQATINRQLLNKADILIGVFWTRIGTPTKDEQGIEHISGSAEEISKHINAGKPTMLFFSKKDVPFDRINTTQYENLIEFKEKYKKKGLIKEYCNGDNPFSNALSLLMRGDEVRKMIHNRAYRFNTPIKDSYKLKFEWQFEDGTQGKRTWYRDGMYLWREEAHAILEDKRFICIEECLLNDVKGVVTQSLSPYDKLGFQVFIPNEREKDMKLYWRIIHSPNNTWSPLGVSEIIFF